MIEPDKIPGLPAEMRASIRQAQAVHADLTAQARRLADENDAPVVVGALVLVALQTARAHGFAPDDFARYVVMAFFAAGIHAELHLSPVPGSDDAPPSPWGAH